MFGWVMAVLTGFAGGDGEELEGFGRELGPIRFGRDLEAAQRACEESRRPVLVLFQEVPG